MNPAAYQGGGGEVLGRQELEKELGAWKASWGWGCRQGQKMGREFPYGGGKSR